MANKKNVLIVGWGTETAKYVFLECIKLNNYDFYLATTAKILPDIKRIFDKDKLLITNPYNEKTLCEDVGKYCQVNQIKFDVVTTFFEMCVYQTAFLAEYLGIEKKLPLRSALKTSVNKYLMRLELEKSGLLQPKFFKFDEKTTKDAFIFFKKIKKSVVIKPVHSGHSYGARYLTKGADWKTFINLIEIAKGDYLKNYDEWMKYEDKTTVEFLIEEFIQGKIFSFDGVVAEEGNIDFIGSTEFELSKPPIMQQIGHTIPICSLNSKQIKEGTNYIGKVVKILGLSYCGFHGEVKFKKNKPMLIEISGRLPGGVITKAYQDLSKYNIVDKFLSIFSHKKRNKILKNNHFYKTETMKIVFSDKKEGVVKNSPKNTEQYGDGFIYKIRSRKEGDKIKDEKDPFGIWLYEIVLKSNEKSSKQLMDEMNKLISEQKIEVSDNIFLRLNRFFVKLKDNFLK